MEKLWIENGIICDGTGNAAYAADVLVSNGKIEKIFPRAVPITSDQPRMQVGEGGYAWQRLNANGAFVTPGFVDIHRHADYALQKAGFGEIELAQGITTLITGSCGLTPFPQQAAHSQMLLELLAPCLGKPAGGTWQGFGDYRRILEAVPRPLHIGGLIGAGAIRIAVKGAQRGSYTPSEMQAAVSYVDEAMQQGAFGLSMGIMYLPEFYNTTDEMVMLAKAAAKYGGVLTTHIRGEGDSLVPSVAEVLEVAKRAEISLQISHFKAAGANNWGVGIQKACALIEKAQAEGVAVHVDVYPYHYGATTLQSLIPPAYMQESPEKTWSFMGTPQGLQQFRQAIVRSYPGWDNYALSLGWDKITITSVENDAYASCRGKTVTQLTQELGYADESMLVCRLMHENNGQVGILVSSMSAEDVDSVAKLPYSFVISDALYNDTDYPHPRLCGSFAKVIRDFVVERKVLTFCEAIHKMSGMPAQKMGLKDRGIIKEGNFADINIFRKENIQDRASLTAPRQVAQGMDAVLVEGQIAYANEKMQGRNNGRVLTLVNEP